MLNKIVHALARKRHPWRTMKFDELAEIYTSMSLRSLAFSLIGIFVPVYLYEKGVSLPEIFFFYGLFFILRVPSSYVASHIVGSIGPKHTIAISNIVFIVFLGMLLSFTTASWPLWLVATFFTVANAMFFVAYNTDFSKIKDSEHGGKELGWLYIFERVGGALGPVVGGLLAAVFAPELTIVFAIAVFIVSLIPLFLTNEPVRLHQHITYKGFPLRRHAADFVSFSAFDILHLANTTLWPLLMAVFIFTEGTYAILGMVVGASLAVSIIGAYMFGRFIDSRRGGSLLVFGVYMNGVLNLCRAAITTSGGAVATTLLGEPINLAYRMPMTKGFYDAGDSEEGYRIVYFSLMEMLNGIIKSLYCFLLWSACHFYDPVSVLRVSFILAAVVGPVMLLQRFPALSRR